MDLFTSYADLPENLRGATVAIGSFDGLHRGHRVLLDQVHQLAQAQNTPKGVVTFYPHPVKVLAPDMAPPNIMGRDDKVAGVAALGFDYLLMQEFTEDFAQMAPQDFALEVLHRQVGVSAVVVGYDFSFGKKAAGKAEDLKAWLTPEGVDVHIIEPQRLDGLVISSTKIRQFVLSGNVRAAQTLLGRPFRLSGPVVSGDQRGRTIGIPTANVQPTQEVVPKRGVYAAWARLGEQTWSCVVNVGLRPTFEGEGVRVEAHLFGFDGDLYGKTLKLDFVDRIRPERKFASKEDLVDQIHKDISETKKILSK